MEKEPGSPQEPTEEEWAEAEWDSGQRSHQWWLRVIAVLAIVGLFAYFVLRPAPEPTEKVPSFELELLSGEGTFSSDDLEGHPTVINFWASWCGPCVDEMPLFEATWQRYKDRGVIFLGVDVQDSPQKAKGFVERLGITYPIVTDYEGELFEDLGAGLGLPRTIFVQADGTILDGASGGAIGTVEAAELEAALRVLTDTRDV